VNGEPQVPLEHVPIVHWLNSQEVPDDALVVPHTPALQVACRHVPGAGQSTAVLHCTQVPLPLQTLPPLSLQGVPLALLEANWQTPDTLHTLFVHPVDDEQSAPARTGFEQSPVCGSHVPAPWHESCAVQTTGDPPVHTPA
jgi:hypothetical protein